MLLLTLASGAAPVPYLAGAPPPGVEKRERQLRRQCVACSDAQKGAVATSCHVPGRNAEGESSHCSAHTAFRYKSNLKAKGKRVRGAKKVKKGSTTHLIEDT